MSHWIGRIMVVGAIALAAMLGGCAAVVGDLMIDAPNAGCTAAQLGQSSPGVLKFWGIDRQFRVEVGPPAASLLVWVIDPIAECGKPTAAPKGTIIVIHGYRDEMEWFTCKARALSRHGYRTVLFDLRGQGSSTGEHLTFGVQESKDVGSLIDALEKRGEIAGPIGVWGMSYGASTAIMSAARDPRIGAVVAVAPFESMRKIVPHFVRLLVPGYGWCATDAELDRIVQERAAAAGLNPDDADMDRAAGAARAPLLLLHGAWDCMVPASHSEHIEAAARAVGREVRRVVLPATGHVSIYFDVTDVVEDESVAW
ncbi:MAG TPA: alpha/beta fold hydrolase, partial [Phycisphaerales bacterium]|nr:alpha/beta fold hydrolase [Phycisphaerales bacterium]